MNDEAQEITLSFVYGVEYSTKTDHLFNDLQEQILYDVSTAVFRCPGLQQKAWQLRRDEDIAQSSGVLKMGYPSDEELFSSSKFVCCVHAKLSGYVSVPYPMFYSKLQLHVFQLLPMLKVAPF